MIEQGNYINYGRRPREYTNWFPTALLMKECPETWKSPLDSLLHNNFFCPSTIVLIQSTNLCNLVFKTSAIWDYVFGKYSFQTTNEIQIGLHLKLIFLIIQSSWISQGNENYTLSSNWLIWHLFYRRKEESWWLI